MGISYNWSVDNSYELINRISDIQFNVCIFKQLLGIPMGGNASPFISD